MGGEAALSFKYQQTRCQMVYMSVCVLSMCVLVSANIVYVCLITGLCVFIDIKILV